MLRLISATPSPYARKVRIALLEKGIPFELLTEVPWDSDTLTPLYNPLEKLPVLLVPGSPSPASGAASHPPTVPHCDPKTAETAVYESHYILEWLEAKYPPPAYWSMYPPSVDADAMDTSGSPSAGAAYSAGAANTGSAASAAVLTDEATEARLKVKQVEVVADGMCDALVLRFFEEQRGNGRSGEWLERQLRKVQGGARWLAATLGEREFMVGGQFSLADVAAGSVLGYMSVRFREYAWQDEYPLLAAYVDRLGARESFAATVPYPQRIRDKVV